MGMLLMRGTRVQECVLLKSLIPPTLEPFISHLSMLDDLDTDLDDTMDESWPAPPPPYTLSGAATAVSPI